MKNFNNKVILVTGVNLSDFDDEVFENIVNINLKAVFYAMKAELKMMLKQNSGVIINMSSVAGLKAGRASAAYTASKHAVMGLTRSAAKEVAPHGIRVNALCPALIQTDMIAEVSTYNEKSFSEGIPVGYMGNAKNVAQAALWLADDNSHYVTGIGVPIDGGIMA
jgi:NAD(P)-dependent dehydrogenase (short-subunit alcohol dehydrogenase family)